MYYITDIWQKSHYATNLFNILSNNEDAKKVLVESVKLNWVDLYRTIIDKLSISVPPLPPDCTWEEDEYDVRSKPVIGKLLKCASLVKTFDGYGKPHKIMARSFFTDAVVVAMGIDNYNLKQFYLELILRELMEVELSALEVTVDEEDKKYKEAILCLVLMCLDHLFEVASHTVKQKDVYAHYEGVVLTPPLRQLLSEHVHVNVCGESLMHLLLRQENIYTDGFQSLLFRQDRMWSRYYDMQWSEFIATYLFSLGFCEFGMRDQEGFHIVNLADARDEAYRGYEEYEKYYRELSNVIYEHLHLSGFLSLNTLD